MLTSPKVGLSPTMPHQLAGMRTEPPVSEPVPPKAESRGDRGGGPPRTNRRRSAGVERIAHIPVVPFLPDGVGCELGHAGLAQQHGSSLVQLRHDRRVCVRYPVPEAAGPDRGDDSARIEQVLVHDRNAVQRTAVVAAGELASSREAASSAVDSVKVISAHSADSGAGSARSARRPAR
jgi:hypothetical protein